MSGKFLIIAKQPFELAANQLKLGNCNGLPLFGRTIIWGKFDENPANMVDKISNAVQDGSIIYGQCQWNKTNEEGTHQRETFRMWLK